MAIDFQIEKFVGRYAADAGGRDEAQRKNTRTTRVRSRARRWRSGSAAITPALKQWSASASVRYRRSFASNLALTQEYAGRLRRGSGELRRSAEDRAPNFRARQALVQLQKQSPPATVLPRLEAQFAGPDEDGWRTLHLGHALAKSYEDFGDIRTRSLGWTGARNAAVSFTPTRRARGGVGESGNGCAPGRAASDDPIFITGLPRSGTTLTDRISRVIRR